MTKWPPLICRTSGAQTELMQYITISPWIHFQLCTTTYPSAQGILGRTFVEGVHVTKSTDFDIGTSPEALEVEYAYQVPKESRMIPGSGKSRLMTAPLLIVRLTGEAIMEAPPRIETIRDVKIMDTTVPIRAVQVPLYTRAYQKYPLFIRQLTP
jgi:hypothetical protein